jgi:hypothetical protein
VTQEELRRGVLQHLPLGRELDALSVLVRLDHVDERLGRVEELCGMCEDERDLVLDERGEEILDQLGSARGDERGPCFASMRSRKERMRSSSGLEVFRDVLTPSQVLSGN